VSLGSWVLLVYAVLMLAGGVAGYRAAASKASLAAGVGSAGLLAVAWWLSRSKPVPGFWLGAVVSLALCAAFAMRLAKTGKVMPSGALLALSVIALVVLTWQALGAQGKL
jgi:uncharacterized membrane protein (UPF0136 family)